MIDFLKRNMFQCFWVKNFGIECFGCGFQRSLIALLEGDLKESFFYYPPLLPILLMITYLIFHLIFKFDKGHKKLVYIFTFNVLGIVCNFIVKIILH